jgi:uncharacterized membrane protein YedE/YeeE
MASMAKRVSWVTPGQTQVLPLLVALLLLAGGAVYLAAAVSGRQSALYLVGGGLGIALYHALFGFTGACRRLVSEGRGGGVRAQLIMLALASAIFAPLLGAGGAFGQPLSGALAPIGVSVMAGAFLFGIGMQLGGGCASGTLFTVGGGSSRMTLTLIAFIAGSLAGSAHLPWWLAQPKIAAVSLYGEMGWPGGLALQLAFIAALALATIRIERKRHGALEPGEKIIGPADALHRLLFGRWPLLWGALALALLNVATLLLAGRPWGITWGYTLWGAKAADAAGLNVAAWRFWQWPSPARALDAGIEQDITSVMNIAIILGAGLAASLAGRFAPLLRIPPRSLAAALIGGLMLGYGARLAFGCNIGAFFSGVASGSLHGWVWLVFGLLGTVAGVYLRPLFGLETAGNLLPRFMHRNAE